MPPFCYAGIVSDDGRLCCAESCGQCGNFGPNERGCGHRLGGADVCCSENIQNRGRECKQTFGHEADGTTGCIMPSTK